MQCREGLTQIQRQSISQKEYQIVKALFQKLPHQLRDHLHLKSSIKPLSKSNVILTGDDSETESQYFSTLFFNSLPRKLLLILIISFWGELVISRGIKRSKGHWWRNSEEVERAWNWSACHTSNSLILGILGSKARRKYFSPPLHIAGCLHIHIGIEGHRRNSLFASIYFSKWLESESGKGAARAEY